jgi:hypothetical protein
MILDGNILRAEDGAVLKRKGTNEIYGEEISLGYSYYRDGVRLDEPHLDTMDDFEEIIEPEVALQIITGQNE